MCGGTYGTQGLRESLPLPPESPLAPLYLVDDYRKEAEAVEPTF